MMVSQRLFYLSGFVRTPIEFYFFFNDTAPTEIYTLSLYDALPILVHEIGHVLGLQHRDGGIMGARLTLREVDNGALGLMFNLAEGRQLRAGASRLHQVLEPALVAGAGR